MAVASRARRRWQWFAVTLVVVGLILAAAWFWPARRAKEEWRQTEAALARHDLESAAAHLDRYLADRPDDADAWFLAARTARRLERWSQAERALERCQQLRGVGEATRLEWDLRRVQRGEIGDIDVRLRKSIHPDHPDALLVLEALARGYIVVERLADARQACDLWIARQPDHPWPWLWRGQIYERLDYLDKALLDYQQAVQLAPQDRMARLALGGLLLRQKQAGPAAEQYEHILERTPDDRVAPLGLAACRIQEGRAGEAIALLDRILEQTPASSRALFLRGKVAREQGHLHGAERWMREAVRLDPNDPEALYQLAQVLRALNQEEEAVHFSGQADQKRIDILRLDDLNRRIVARPDDPRLRHEAGVIALGLGRSEEGLRLLHSVLRLKGSHPDTHAVLADWYHGKGDRERAAYHRSLAAVSAR